MKTVTTATGYPFYCVNGALTCIENFICPKFLQGKDYALMQLNC